MVAGTNYAVQFDAYFDCSTPSNKPSYGSVRLNAIIYQPLPTQGINQQLQVSITGGKKARI